MPYRTPFQQHRLRYRAGTKVDDLPDARERPSLVHQVAKLEEIEILTGVKPNLALLTGATAVGKPQGVGLLLSHTRGLPRTLKKLLKRRQPIEPTIGHMKNDGLLACNWLMGIDGDTIHAVLCGAGHNLRLIVAHLRMLVLAPIGLLVLNSASSPAPLRQLRSTV